MIQNHKICLAKLSDATRMAEMSRDYIEHGLGWNWTRSSIEKKIRNKECNVAVAREGNTIIGFAIMKYQQTEAHLQLFAVDPENRRRGFGSSIIHWLVEVAVIAGISAIYVELRVSNKSARNFYRHFGFKDMETLPKYYCGIESGIRMVYRLHNKIID